METKRINEAVKNNPEKFPEGYLIQISKDEWVGLKSKFSTSKRGGKVTTPTAFPEKGLYMLATILKSPQATEATFTINGSVLGLTKREPERRASRVWRTANQIDAKINEIIDFAEIREFIDMPVQSYSSGMPVRLGFAVATAMNPDFLIWMKFSKSPRTYWKKSQVCLVQKAELDIKMMANTD